MPKDGSTLAVLYTTYSSQTGAIAGRYVKMVKWNATANDFIEDPRDPLDTVGRPLGWVATGALPF